MRILQNWEDQERPAERPPVVLTIGTFDGLHLGHHHLIEQVIKNAKKLKSQSLVLTFEPHPLVVLAEAAAPPILTTLEQKAAILTQWGLDTLGVLRFSKHMAGLEPGKFLNQIIDRYVRTTGVMFGPDFTFGRNAEGGLDQIRAWTEGNRARLWVAAIQKGRDGVYSSSQIRQDLKDNLVEAAQRALGRPYRLTGEVVHGAARGRDLGFPTANLGRIVQLTPGPGVYAAWAFFEEEYRGWPAMVSIGYNPTFGEQPMTVEAHLLDFDGFLYGRRMSLDFVSHLRPMARFASADKLAEQLGRDREAARRVLSLKTEA